VVERARRLLDLDADVDAVAAHLSADPVLGPRVVARPGLRVPGAWDPFEVAVRAVLGQQVSVAGATTLAGRLVERFGVAVPGLGAMGLTHLFPQPAALVGADLRAVGLPARRAAAIAALAGAVLDARVSLDGSRPYEATVADLVALPGIGPWTAEYVALRACGERDAFPAGDLGIRRALADGAALPAATAVAVRAEPWRPFRAYAALHLWTR
jgi:AraC family transcriptional regulator of adaptative response / DNA-3-methyladenine glycosylase II